MKQWLIALVILGILIYYFGFYKAAITYQNIYIGGKVQKYFSVCNPCQFYVEMTNEDKAIEDVKFDVTVSGDTIREHGCVPLEPGPTQNCQKYGYDGPESACCADLYCKSYERWCYREVSCGPGKVTIKTDNVAVFESSVSGKTYNMANVLNANNPNIGKDCGYMDCPKATIYFNVYAENSCGSFDISNTPTVLVYKTVTPTTTTTTKTTLTSYTTTKTTGITTTYPVTTTVPPTNFLQYIVVKIQEFFSRITWWFRR